ncbi:MAG: hypothetical protein WCW31_01925 [Patescibacteria group bacterium]|jgi:hypothetical protein
MRIYTHQHTIVDVKHFRFCAKHYNLLLVLQQEMPNLCLEVVSAEGAPFRLPIHKLNLENQEDIRRLNPNEM